jgi:hypothetical protein
MYVCTHNKTGLTTVAKLKKHLRQKEDATLTRLFAVFQVLEKPSQGLDWLLDARLLLYDIGQLPQS